MGLSAAEGPCGRTVGADGGGEGREGAAHFGANAAGGKRMVGFWLGKWQTFHYDSIFLAVLMSLILPFGLKIQVRRQ